MNPYKILGVAKDAGPTAIRAAYRRRAKVDHPDAGGNAETFAHLRLAYEVLTDPERRARYDETGEVDPTMPDNLEQQAMSLLSDVLRKAIEEDGDVATSDLRVGILAFLEKQCGDIERSLRQVQKRIARAEAIRDRMVAKEGENRIAEIMGWQIRQMQEACAKREGAIAVHKRAIDVLEGYEYRFEEPKRSTSGFFVNMSTAA